MCKMVDISVEKHADAKVYTITVPNKELFWVRMCYVQTSSIRCSKYA